MTTPPPYTPPSCPRQPVDGHADRRTVKMSAGGLAALLIGCVVCGMLCSLGLWNVVLGEYYTGAYMSATETDKVPVQRASETSVRDKSGARHYVADREISFEMNAGSGFVRIPAQDVWVRKYEIRKFRAAMPFDSVLTVDDGHYRFSADVSELRRACGDGARPMPIKWTLTDMTSNRDKSFHITTLLVQYREDGTADVQVAGYMFDK